MVVDSRDGTSLRWSGLMLMILFSMTERMSLAQSTPTPTRPDITVRNVLFTGTASPCIRLVKDPRDNSLYYLKQNGNIFQVDLQTATSRQIYSFTDHGCLGAAGMAIGPNGTMYLVGNADQTSGMTQATIIKGVLSGGTRFWSILAQTAPYPKSHTAFDHLFNGLVVDPSGSYLYVNSGSRTDHGEEQSNGGLFPGTREVGLTACILRLPTDSLSLHLDNDRAALINGGYLFAQGTRNTYDLAFAPNGDLFGPDNGPDRDMSDELNWLQSGHNYGFPWRFGAADNPQRFPGYDPTLDLLLDPRYAAVQGGYWHNDPTFPSLPVGVTFDDAIPNSGPDADYYRDSDDGLIKKASTQGLSSSTFTPHRSPLGIVFDVAHALSPEFSGDGFVLSWTAGDPNGNSVAGPFDDASQDLLDLKLTKTNGRYYLSALRLVQGFNHPIAAAMISNKIYVIEYGGSQGLWEVTLPDAAPTISGSVTLQGVASGSLAQPLTFTLTPTGSTAGSATTQTVTPAADGTFSMSSVPRGTFTLGVKGAKWLRRNVALDTTGGSVALPSAVSLLGGDLNGDNQVSTQDLGLVRQAYGSAPGAANWNPLADINCDGQVSTQDLGILRSNYGKLGDP